MKPRRQVGTGALWRIRRVGAPHGAVPPKPVTVPLYVLQALLLLTGMVGLAALLLWALWKLIKAIQED
jgi:hypothetical protein